MTRDMNTTFSQRIIKDNIIKRYFRKFRNDDDRHEDDCGCALVVDNNRQQM